MHREGSHQVCFLRPQALEGKQIEAHRGENEEK